MNANTSENLEVICAWCPDFDRNDPRNANATHGICPTCEARIADEWLRDDSGRAVAPAPVADNYSRPAGPWDANVRRTS